MVQNLLWSGTKFLESCNDKLLNKIKECTKSYAFMEKTGLVYFSVALEMIQSSAEAVLRTLTRELETISLKNIDGENDWTLTSILCGIADQLSSNAASSEGDWGRNGNFLVDCCWKADQ